MNKGFGFVHFAELDSVRKVFRDAQSTGIEMNGRSLDIRRAIPKDVSEFC